MIRLINYIKEEKKMKSDYSMNKDINPSRIPQEYSNNTNQSSNLPSISLNNSNQSNFDYFILNLKKKNPTEIDELNFINDLILELYIQQNPLKKVISNTKTLLKNKSYIEFTNEEKLLALTKIGKALKEIRFTILSSIVQILVKYIEPIDQNFIHLIQKNRENYNNLTVRECFLVKINKASEEKQNLILEQMKNKQEYKTINDFLNLNVWDVIHKTIEDPILEKTKRILGKV